MEVRFSPELRNAMAAAVEPTIGASPTLRIRSGPQPATTQAARQGTVLAQTVLPSDWLGAPVAGVATANAIPEFAAIATGEAGHYEIVQGSVCHWQGDVSDDAGDGSMKMATTSISANLLVRVNYLTVQVGEG
jgi:hypothetical protein